MTFAAVAAVLGWVGTVLMILGYWLVSTRRVEGSGAVFQSLNVGGSAGLGVAAISGGVWSAATLNGIWIAIGLGVLARRRRTPVPATPIVGPRTASAGRAAPDEQELT